MIINAFNINHLHYRKINLHLYDFHAEGIHMTGEFGIFGGIGNWIDTMTLKNLYIFNCTNNFVLISGGGFKNMLIENITFIDIPDTLDFALFSTFNINVTIRQLNITNYSSVPSLSSSFMLFQSLPYSFVKLEDIYIENCNFNSFPIFSSVLPLASISIKNGYYKNVTLAFESTFFSFIHMNSFIFQNHTIVDSGSHKVTDVKSNFVNIGALYLDTMALGVFEGLTFINSEVSVFKIAGMLGSPTNLKVISLTNLNYKDSYFTEPRQLISLEGMLSQGNISVILSDIHFVNLQYKTVGLLINLNHQLPNPVILKDSTFTNIISGGINVKTFNTNLGILPTIVQMVN